MNIYGNSAVQTGLESGACAVLTTLPLTRNTFQEDEAVDYSTIDGEVITSVAGTSALERGAGIMIGDYFVGILEGFSTLGSRPFLRY